MIDLHTHILPEHWPSWTAKSGYAGWVELAHHKPGCATMQQTTSVDGSTAPKLFREVDCNCWDLSKRLHEMNRAGVRVQVLSTVPVMFSHWAKPADALDLHRLLNDHLAECCRQHPTRFSALACIPMHDPDLACRELDRCITHLGIPGIQIGTNIAGANLDAPGPRQVLAHAANLGAAVFVHPWDMLGGERLANYWMPWLVGMPTETTIAMMSVIFGGVLDDLPSLRICFAHGGGSFPGTLGRIEHGHEARPDLFPASAKPLRDYLRDPATGRPARVWLDSLVHDARALELIIDLFGASRVAVGSDYPFPLGEAVPGTLVKSLLRLSEQQRQDIFLRSAAEFLGPNFKLAETV